MTDWGIIIVLEWSIFLIFSSMVYLNLSSFNLSVKYVSDASINNSVEYNLYILVIFFWCILLQ